MSCLFLKAEKLGTLDTLLKPASISITDGKVLVMDMDNVKVYEQNTLKMLYSFGRQGEGPGEFTVTPRRPLVFRVAGDQVVVESFNKVSVFTMKGILVNEIRKNDDYLLFYPLGTRYLGMKKAVTVLEGEQYPRISLNIFDSELHSVQEFYHQQFVEKAESEHSTVNMGQDFLHYGVYQGKIYVETDSGPAILVFDSNGKMLTRHPFRAEGIQITPSVREELIRKLKTDPHIVSLMKRTQMSWEQLSRLITLQFPEKLSPVCHMDIDEGMIYLFLNRGIAEQTEVLRLALQGQERGRTTIPRNLEQGLMSKLLGVNLYCVYRGSMYWIQENLDNESWELWRQRLLFSQL